MRLAHVCDYATARVFKEVYELQKRNDVLLIYRRCQHGDLLQTITCSTPWAGLDNVAFKIAAWRPDIIHVHTSISSKNLFPELAAMPGLPPLVLDIHDLCAENHEHLHRASVVVIPSEGYSARISHERKLVLHSKCPSEWSPARWRSPSGWCLASEVGVSEFRDYRPLQKEIPELVVFPANSDVDPCYRNVMARLPYFRMLSELSGYSVGYAGAPNIGENFNDIVTNKFWEYIAAGTKVCVFQSREMAALLEAHCLPKVEAVKLFGKHAFVYTPIPGAWTHIDEDIKSLEQIYKTTGGGDA